MRGARKRGIAAPLGNDQAEPEKPLCETMLYAVIVHTGLNVAGGHYYTYVKAQHSRSSTDVWYKMNDGNMEEVSFDRVQSDEAYMLFYDAPAHCRSQGPSLSLVPEYAGQLPEAALKPIVVDLHPASDLAQAVTRAHAIGRDSLSRQVGMDDDDGGPRGT